MRPTRRRGWISACLLAVTAPATGPASASPLAELAVSYERLERLVVRLGMSAEAIDTADEALETATAMFFGRRMNQAAVRLDRAALTMLGLQDDPAAAWLTSLEPRDAVPGTGEQLVLRPRAAVATPPRPSAEDLGRVRLLLIPDGPAEGPERTLDIRATGTIAAAAVED